MNFEDYEPFDTVPIDSTKDFGIFSKNLSEYDDIESFPEVKSTFMNVEAVKKASKQSRINYFSTVTLSAGYTKSYSSAYKNISQ
jgi:hypothetical protein